MGSIRISTLFEPPVKIWNRSVGLFYQQWTHRYLLYFAACALVVVWTFVAFEIYGWKTWRMTSTSFRGIHSLHTMMNFGLCLYLLDEWLVRLTGRWGRFEHRTLGKQALIWAVSFVIAFYVQRTIVFEGIMYYALDIYHYYEMFPEMRPRPLGHFLFCLPFFVATILLLGLVAFARQRGLEKDRDTLVSLTKELAAKEEALAGNETPERLPVRFQAGNNQVILEQDRISHITVEDHYCRICTVEEEGAKSYFVKSSLAELLQKVPTSHFIQIHRSHVINVDAVHRLEKKNRAYRIHLKSNAVLPVSRHRITEVVQQIEQALEPKDI